MFWSKVYISFIVAVWNTGVQSQKAVDPLIPDLSPLNQYNSFDLRDAVPADKTTDSNPNEGLIKQEHFDTLYFNLLPPLFDPLSTNAVGSTFVIRDVATVNKQTDSTQNQAFNQKDPLTVDSLSSLTDPLNTPRGLDSLLPSVSSVQNTQPGSVSELLPFESQALVDPSSHLESNPIFSVNKYLNVPLRQKRGISISAFLDTSVVTATGNKKGGRKGKGRNRKQKNNKTGNTKNESLNAADIQEVAVASTGTKPIANSQAEPSGHNGTEGLNNPINLQSNKRKGLKDKKKNRNRKKGKNILLNVADILKAVVTKTGIKVAKGLIDHVSLQSKKGKKKKKEKRGKNDREKIKGLQRRPGLGGGLKISAFLDTSVVTVTGNKKGGRKGKGRKRKQKNNKTGNGKNKSLNAAAIQEVAVASTGTIVNSQAEPSGHNGTEGLNNPINLQSNKRKGLKDKKKNRNRKKGKNILLNVADILKAVVTKTGIKAAKGLIDHVSLQSKKGKKKKKEKRGKNDREKIIR